MTKKHDTKCIESSGKHSRYNIVFQNHNLTIVNDNKKLISVYIVDECLLKDQIFKRCDRLVEIENSNQVFFIEFKGSSDLEKACEQLANTINYYNDLYSQNQKKCFILCKRMRHPKTSSNLNNWKLILRKRYNASLQVSSTGITVHV